MGNRGKDCQLNLFSHQTSAHGFKPNQLRRIFVGFDYVLITQLRLRTLKGTDLARALGFPEVSIAAYRTDILLIGASKPDMVI